MAARISIVLCLVLVIIIGAALVASPAEARAVPGGYAAPPGDIMTGATIRGGRPGGIRRRGKWNVRSLQDGTHKREVPGGPDPQHHY
jgi:hypothetical protein